MANAESGVLRILVPMVATPLLRDDRRITATARLDERLVRTNQAL